MRSRRLRALGFGRVVGVGLHHGSFPRARVEDAVGWRVAPGPARARTRKKRASAGFLSSFLASKGTSLRARYHLPTLPSCCSTAFLGAERILNVCSTLRFPHCGPELTKTLAAARAGEQCTLCPSVTLSRHAWSVHL